MKIVKIWKRSGVLNYQNYILSFTSEELFFLCPLLKKVLHFITIENNGSFVDRKFKNFRKKTKFGVIESKWFPNSPCAFQKDIKDIVEVEKDSDCEGFTWCRIIGYGGNSFGYKIIGYGGNSREFGYNAASIAKHFGLNKDSLARGKFRRSPDLIENNEYMFHFNVDGPDLVRCLDKIVGLKLWIYHLIPQRRILGRFVELCREEVKIYKKEKKDFDEYQRRNPDIIY